MAVRRWTVSVDGFHAAGHEVHEEVAAEVGGSGEVGFAAAHG